ncbi:PD40 domain-containing protein [candidate division WOR-3 bacterium]|nr:PD40 domain-containing protein [candidate division WOR-3 bacterium]
MKNLILTSILAYSAAFAQGYWAEPVKLPPVINDTVEIDTLWHRYYAHISPDGKEMYYTLNNSPYDDDIYVARWKGGNEWDSVTRLSVNMNDVRRELSPSITADHSKLFWTAWDRPGGYGGYDVWFAEWDSVAGDWGEPQNAGPNVNTPGYEFTCFISADGKTLYASSLWDADGEDIFKHSWQDSCWGPREKVFETYYVGGDQWSPWVTADGSWLYISQWGADIHGERSIWRSHWEGSFFSKPEWLGEPVCIPGAYQWNEGPSLTADGSRLYFDSNRPDSIEQEAFLWYSEYVDADEEKQADEQFDLKVSRLATRKAEISYTLPSYSRVFCGVFDSVGNLVRILTSEVQDEGTHTTVWDGLDDRGRQVASGTYFLQLTVGSHKTSKKTVYLR